ncbi:hypothetical protein ACO0KY_01720 [Undibacterium sp. Dicai25W]
MDNTGLVEAALVAPEDPPPPPQAHMRVSKNMPEIIRRKLVM